MFSCAAALTKVTVTSLGALLLIHSAWCLIAYLVPTDLLDRGSVITHEKLLDFERLTVVVLW